MDNSNKPLLNLLFLKFYCCLGLILLLSLQTVDAQITDQQKKYTIQGTVVNATDNTPIPNASVLVKESKNGTFTDTRGHFSISVFRGQTLVISEVSHFMQEITITDGAPVNISLESIQDSLKDVVVIGFGTQKKGDVTSAISTVDVQKDLVGKPFTDIGKGLQGAVPGLQITYADGEISGANGAPKISIRGGISVNGGSPLILVDGVDIGDITQVNPNDIADISILKDAASTSIYGTRAAAGVVLITTKSGRKNTRFSLNYNSNFSWSSPTELPSFADPLKEIPINDGAMQRAAAGNWGQFGMGGSEPAIDSELTGIKNWIQNYKGKESGNDMIKGQDFGISNSSVLGVGNRYFYRLWDPTKIMYQTMPAMNHNINMSGGTDKLSYYVSGSYSAQEGILKPNPDRVHVYNILASVTADPTPWLTLQAKMTDRQYNYYSPYLFGQDPIYTMWRWGTYLPYGTYTDPNNGTPYYWRSPLGYLKNAGNSNAKNNTVTSNISATIKFTPWLNLHSDFSYRYSSTLSQSYGGVTPYYEWWTVNSKWSEDPVVTNPWVASLGWYPTNDVGDFYATTFTTQITSNTYLTYNQRFGLHNLKVTAGLNAENGEAKFVNTGGYDLIDPTLGEIAFLLNQDGVLNSVQRTLFAGAGATAGTPDYTKYPYISGDHTWFGDAGYFARINYDYDNRYLLEIAGRYDGSSSFPLNDAWAFFPSVSAGWNITNEKFTQSIRKVVHSWKIRASYGTNGNSDFGSNPPPYLALMSTGTNSWLMSNGQKAQYVGLPANVPVSLTWEKIKKFDIGTDMSFLKGDLGVTFDWFQNENIGMITGGVILPATFGTGAAKTNNGNMRTRGFELSFDYHHQFTNGLSVYGNANLFNFVSKIIKIGGNPTNLLSNYYNGDVVGEIWGFQTAGFFQDANDVVSSPYQGELQSGKFVFGPGDIKYADLDGNDTINAGTQNSPTLANHGDLKKIGNTSPRYQYSFRLGASWKGFDIDAFFQGVGARQMWATGDLVIPDYMGNGELLGNQMDFSTYNTGTNADVLSPTSVNNKAWWPNPYYGNGTSQIAGEGGWANTPGGTSAGVSGNNFYPQTKYLLNLAYLRLKTLTIGYTLPSRLTRKADIQSLRFYVQGMNILTFDHNNHVPIDPEMTALATSGNAAYGQNAPVNKTYAFGIQLTF